MDLSRLFLPQQDFPVKVVDPRRCARRVVRIPTTVEDKCGLTKGMVTNISEAGCKLQLGAPFFPNHHLTLKLYPHDGTASLQITRAQIRWVDKKWAGVEFVNLPQEDQAKLQRLCSKPVATSSG
jgi:hypothetical protein